MKNLTITLILLLGLVINSYSQKTYYNPSNNVNVTITVREPYRPVDYSKIGRDFNTMLENEKQKRQELIKYYDEIFFETKSSVINNTILTTDNLINNKILLVQRKVIEKLDLYYKLFREGLLKRKDFESNLRNIYFTYMEINQVFLNIVQYKYNKNLSLVDNKRILEHDTNYNMTLNSISDFEINDTGNIEFKLSDIIYPNKTLSSLFDFVKSSSEGGFQLYKKGFTDKQKNEYRLLREKSERENREFQEKSEKEKEQKLVIKKEYEKLNELRVKTFDLRKSKLVNLDEKGKKTFKKKEREYIFSLFEKSYLDEGVVLKPKILNAMYENIFLIENENFQFIRLYRINKEDPLRDPQQQKKFETYLNYILSFSQINN